MTPTQFDRTLNMLEIASIRQLEELQDYIINLIETKLDQDLY